MRVELAGVPFEVRCRFPENEVFLKDYETSKAPLFVIAPTDEDLVWTQGEYDRSARCRREAPRRHDAPYLENTALMLLAARELVDYDVLQIHGSALCMDGEGYLFMAPSGTGKSTHARLWRETFGDRVWMVNDDKPLLRIEEDRVLVCGTPWDGKHHLSRNASVPLKAMACLYRNEANCIRAISKVEAFPFILRQAIGSNDPTIQDRFMALEARLVSAVPCYALGCTVDAVAAKMAWEGMN